jgi:hypothetical protein
MIHSQKISKIGLLLGLLQWATIISGLMQPFIEASSINIVSTTLAVFATTCVVQYIKHTRCYETNPLSTLAIIGLNVTTISTSLIVQTCYLNPLVHLLRAPELTFPVLFVLHVLACATHTVHRKFSPNVTLTQGIAANVLRPLGLFRAPSIQTLWIMGTIGMVSQLVGQAAMGDVGGKAFQAFGFLAWMPLLALMYHAAMGDSYCNKKTQYFWIAAYLFALFALGAARNVRFIMFAGPVQIALTYFLYVSTHNSEAGKKTYKAVAAALLATVLGVTIASDFATAMVIAREKRDSYSGAEMIQETLSVLQEPERIADYRSSFELAATIKFYDEAYIPNPILGRFSETKFHDNMLYFASNFQAENIDDLIFAAKQKVLVIFPEPFVKYFYPDFEKTDFFFSMGDYYVYQIKGPGGLYSFVTGSMWADIYSIFGWWACPMLVLVLFVSHICLDSMSLRQGGKVFIAPVAICSAWTIFMYGLGADSLVTKLSFWMRELPQRIVLYAVVLWILDTAYPLFRMEKARSRG